MAVYIGDNAENFTLAYRSLCNQTLPPTEIIIAIDGPIDDDLEMTLIPISDNTVVKIIRFDINQGAGFVRDQAIQQAKYPIIAIMDSDDICESNRFEIQLPYIVNKKADVVGSFIAEFDNNPTEKKIIRTVPEFHQEIFKYGKWRLPTNHVTIVFTKLVYNNAGGYTNIRFHEDYDFIVRLLMSGAKFYNIQDVLVCVRTGLDMFNRRRGVDYVFSEAKLFYKMYRINYISLMHFILNIFIRIIIRFFPNIVIKNFYTRLLRKK